MLFQPRVTVVLFEGGQARTTMDEAVAGVRRCVVLETLEKLKKAQSVDDIVVVTNYPGLATEADRMGIGWDLEEAGAPRFHFGRRLREVIVKRKLENVIYMGGAAAPLLSAEEFDDVALALKRERNLVIVNNVQSADLVAFSPARAIDELELPDGDNSLGTLLRDIGMRRLLIPNSGRVNFDLDTPTDILILGMHPDCGSRVKRAIDFLNWPRQQIDDAFSVMRESSKEVAVIGRVGPAVIQYINANLVHRMRVFSEERGMKALGRESRGEVVSFLGFALEELGPRRFFKYLASSCDVAFIDTRVIFGHLKKRLSDWDRFQSDLGQFWFVEDPWVKEFTRCAGEAGIPVVLGGHSLVAAGLWLMAEMIAKEREDMGYRHNTFIMSTR